MPFGQLRLSEPTRPAASVVLPFRGRQMRAAPAGEPRAIAKEDSGLLRRLRGYLETSRVTRDPNLDRACALIAADPAASAELYAVALLQYLPRAARRRVVFHQGRDSEPTPDEMWLIRLIRATQAGDEVSREALLGFRIQPKARRVMRFLVNGLATALIELDIQAWDCPRKRASQL